VKTMRNPIKTVLAAAALSSACASAVLAGEAANYPRLVGGADNSTVEYGPGTPNNVMGGGAVAVSITTDGIELRHGDASFARRGPAGLMPVLLGSGENSEIAWVANPGASTLVASAFAGAIRN
jgi:hypothetical protein